MLHEKVFHVNKKKVDVAQKSISCRQKQDDAASKKHFVRKKSYYFSRNGAPQIPSKSANQITSDKFHYAMQMSGTISNQFLQMDQLEIIQLELWCHLDKSQKLDFLSASGIETISVVRNCVRKRRHIAKQIFYAMFVEYGIVV